MSYSGISLASFSFHVLEILHKTWTVQADNNKYGCSFDLGTYEVSWGDVF